MSLSLFFEDLELDRVWRDVDMVWMADAACARMPGLPWIDEPNRVPGFVWELMAEVCASCPVLARCRDFVAEAEVTAGYWAGQSRDQLDVQDDPRNPRIGGEAA